MAHQTCKGVHLANIWQPPPQLLLSHSRKLPGILIFPPADKRTWVVNILSGKMAVAGGGGIK